MIAQLGIALFGLLAVGLTQAGPKWRDIAPFVGLCGQPFWFAATMGAGQWGMFLLTLAYTAIWTAGCWRVLREDFRAN